MQLEPSLLLLVSNCYGKEEYAEGDLSVGPLMVLLFPVTESFSYLLFHLAILSPYLSCGFFLPFPAAPFPIPTPAGYKAVRGWVNSFLYQALGVSAPALRGSRWELSLNLGAQS